MSSRLQRCIQSLELAGFLRSTGNLSAPNLELLQHGAAYAKQLQQQWWHMRQLAVNLGSSSLEESSANPRFSFVDTKQFKEHFQQLLQLHPSRAKCPTLLKHCSSTFDTQSHTNTMFKQCLPVTQLITDFFVEPHRGLEHFYNVQRESKIWWMRFASNPSRISIVPYTETKSGEDSQAIDIRAAFGEAGEVTVEQLSLVTLPEEQQLELPDARTGKLLLPKVIRSIIPLEAATVALLLDGCDHGRESQSLLLNRILAPYQCSIAAVQKKEQTSTDLRDLCVHMADVLQCVHLRLQLFDKQPYKLAKHKDELAVQFEHNDRLGVPYTLLLDEQQCLKTGLLQLRSRDTQLAESIHISDLPDYLLNIFRNS